MLRILLVAALLSAPAAARASQAVRVSVEELATTSDAVVRGRVLMATAQWMDRRIYTVVELETIACLRGEAAPNVVLLVPGGVVGEVGQRVAGAPTFASGEETIVFLRRAELGVYRVAGLAQGKFEVKGAYAVPDLSGIGFVGDRVAAGQRAVGAMPVAELERLVEEAR
jgi:hypothetical protein